MGVYFTREFTGEISLLHNKKLNGQFVCNQLTIQQYISIYAAGPILLSQVRQTFLNAFDLHFCIGLFLLFQLHYFGFSILDKAFVA
jgi:hypothetical protein